MNLFAAALVAERLDRYRREAEDERLAARARAARRALAAPLRDRSPGVIRRFVALRIDAAGRLARRAAAWVDPSLHAELVRAGTGSSRQVIRS